MIDFGYAFEAWLPHEAKFKSKTIQMRNRRVRRVK
jgi:hypothetical protein